MPSQPIADVSQASCVSAFEKGQRLWLTPEGAMIILFRDSYYFIDATPQGLTCRVVRYAP